MRIRELLNKKQTTEVICTKADRTLLDAAYTLMKNQIGALVVIDDQKRLAGIVSERDIVKSLANFGDEAPSLQVQDIMTASVVTCCPEDDVVKTLAIMNHNKFRHMPVLEDGDLKAIMSIREFDAACQHLQTLARTDELTGLANRRHFIDVMESELSRHDRLERPMSIAMLDIDKFKLINDTYGHGVGDQVLRSLAKILKGRLRGYDLVARLGGEEFALLLPNTELLDAVAVCENLRETIKDDSVETNIGKINYTASFGLARYSAQHSSSTELLNAADKCLYRAKDAGRDQVAWPQEEVSQSNTPKVERMAV